MPEFTRGDAAVNAGLRLFLLLVVLCFIVPFLVIFYALSGEGAYVVVLLVIVLAGLVWSGFVFFKVRPNGGRAPAGTDPDARGSEGGKPEA